MFWCKMTNIYFEYSLFLCLYIGAIFVLIKPCLILHLMHNILGPVVQSVVSLTSSLRVILLTILMDSIYNILIFFVENICVSLDITFNA